MEKQLPCNIDAERAVLGSVLIDPKALPSALDLVRAEDFYREAHRIIFTAMADLFAAGTPVDLITLCDELERRGQLEQVDGASGVSALANQVPTSRNVKHYAEEVRRDALLRRLIDMAGQAAGIAYSRPDANVAYDQILRMVINLGMQAQSAHNPPHSVADMFTRLHEDTLRRMDLDEVPGVRTGFKDLDRLFLCLEPGNLIYIVGRPADGKTSLGLDMAEHMALDCRRAGSGSVDFLSLEMSEMEIVRRIAAKRSRINSRMIRAGFRAALGAGVDDESYQAFDRALQEAREELGPYLYTRGGPMTTAQIRAHAQAAIAERDLKVLFVDQLSKLADPMKDDTRIWFNTMSNELKQIASQLGIVIICMAQLSRSAEGTRPTKADIKESGKLEEDADAVIALHRPAVYDWQRAANDAVFSQYAEAHVIKGRDVPWAMVPLHYMAEYTQFSDWPAHVALPADVTRK